MFTELCTIILSFEFLQRVCSTAPKQLKREQHAIQDTFSCNLDSNIMFTNVREFSFSLLNIYFTFFKF